MPDADTIGGRGGDGPGGVDAMVALHFAGRPAPVARAGRRRRAAAGARDRGRRARPRDAGSGTARSGPSPPPPASASTRPRTCRSARAAWSRPPTRPSPTYVRRARLHGMSRDAWTRYLPGGCWRYDVEIAGLKANMTDMQAAIGRAQLRHLPGGSGAGPSSPRGYDAGWPDRPGMRTPAAPGQRPARLAPLRDRARPRHRAGTRRAHRALADRGIDCSVHFIPLHHQPYFSGLLGEAAGRFPGADQAFDGIALPAPAPEARATTTSTASAPRSPAWRRRRARMPAPSDRRTTPCPTPAERQDHRAGPLVCAA